MRWPGNFVWLAAAVLAIGAEWLALPGTTGGAAAADLVAGATILFAGLVAWRFSPDSLLGPLLAAAGVSWFVGTVATAHVGFIAAIGALAVTLHRGPLVHAVLCYPSGRLAGRLVGVVVVIAYLCAVVTPLGESRAATATLVVLLAATSVRGYATGGMAERRVRRTNLTGSALLSFALLLVVGAGHWEASGFSSAMILGAYEVSLAGLVLALVIGLIRRGSSERAVTDLVVELEVAPMRARCAEDWRGRSATRLSRSATGWRRARRTSTSAERTLRYRRLTPVAG